jgi:DNA polymerase-1
MPNIKRFLDSCERKAAKNKEIGNIYGRKRRLKSYITPWGNITNSGARKSYNHPIQSFGAEVIKLALIRVYKKILTKEEYKGLVYFMSTIHDEINFSVDKKHVKKISYDLGKAMEHKMRGYPVVIVTDLEIGNSMGLLWKFSQDEETLELSPKYIEYWGESE